jgi:hypothetical protein
MWKFLFSVISFFIAAYASAQGNELGISVLSYSTINTNYYQADTVAHNRIKSIISFQPVLTYNHISSKNIDLSVQAGFFYSPRTTNDKSSDQVSTIYYTRVKFLQKAVYIKIGFAKRNYLNKLILISGINIPFQATYSTKVENYRSTYNIGNDTLIAAYQYHDSFAPEYTTGINLQQSFYYPISKRFYLGIDLNLGFIASIMNGKRHMLESEVNYINPSNSYSSDVELIYKTNIQTSLFFQPSISLKYNLK